MAVMVGVLAFLPQAMAQGTLRFALAQPDSSGFDPHLEIPGGTIVQVSTMFNGLVRYPPGTTDANNIEPDLAESFASTDGGKTWRFQLRQGVPFHEGYGELTSSDVKFTFERVASAELASPWRSQFANVRQIRTPDRYVVEIELEEADPLFLINIAGHPRGAILSERAVTELGAAFRQHPIGTGPFRFVEYQPAQMLVVERNPEYFREAERAKLDGIEFHYVAELSSMYIGLQRKDYDAAGGVDTKQFAERVASLGLDVVTHGLGASVILFLDTKIAPFDDLRVRQAFSHAVDKQAMARALYGASGEAWDSPVPIGALGYTDDLVKYAYAPERARELLAEAGFADGLRVKVLMSDHAVYSPPMVVLQDMLTASGIQMELQTIEHSTYHEQIRQHLTPIVLYSALRPPEAGIWLREFFDANTPETNFSNSTAVTELIESANETVDLQERAAFYGDAQRIIMDEALAIPLYRRLSVQAYQAYVNLNYEVDNTVIYYPDHFEFMSLER